MIKADENEESSLENPLVQKSAANRYQEQLEAHALSRVGMTNLFARSNFNFVSQIQKFFLMNFQFYIVHQPQKKEAL